MFNWEQIDTVLLDMDGTLLDLHYDNFFWLEYLPTRYAQLKDLEFEEAQAHLFGQFHQVRGTLDWYCLDYWSRQTKLNIRALKQEVEHKIAWKHSAKPFLHALKQRGIRRILLTNAHPDNLALKIRHTHLDQYLDELYSTHQFGHCKESSLLWQALIEHHPFEPERTLFIDDNEDILMAAKQFGIAYQLGISQPDSKQTEKAFLHFPSVANYQALTEDLEAG